MTWGQLCGIVCFALGLLTNGVFFNQQAGRELQTVTSFILLQLTLLDVFISQWGKTFAVQLLPAELALVFISAKPWIFRALCQFEQCCACPTWFHLLCWDRSSSRSTVAEAGWFRGVFHYRFVQHVLQGCLYGCLSFGPHWLETMDKNNANAVYYWYFSSFMKDAGKSM